MGREAAGIERIERPYIGEKLIELRFNLQRGAAIPAEGICQTIQREDETFRSLAEQWASVSVRREFPIRRSEREQ